MKRSLDALVATPVVEVDAETETADDGEQQLVHPFVPSPTHHHQRSHHHSPMEGAKTLAGLPQASPPSPSASGSPSKWNSASSSSGAMVSSVCTVSSRPTRMRRRTCDLEHSLREEGLVRLVFACLDVRDHHVIKSCCRSWSRLIQTLSLDKLDLSAATSPLTTTTIDRAFVSVLHNYSTVRHIDLSGQRSLCDRDLLVVTSCFWSHLERITVNDCLELTDFGLLSILNAQSQRLQSVSMRHCKQITGSFGHDQVTGRHPSLTTLDLSDTRVSYSLVEGLELQFPSLERIHATHTPAHLAFFERMQWHDLLEELQFLVSNEMSDLPHVVALLEEYSTRVQRCQRRRHSETTTTDTMSVFYRTLLDSGARALVDAPLQQGEFVSALLYACENGLTNVIPALVTHGKADVEATDKDGASALCVAVTNGLTDVVRLLIEQGHADINKRTHCLATPLYIATEMNWDDVVEVLLAFNARATCAVVGGATALCVAAKNGNRSAVGRLLVAEHAQCRNQLTNVKDDVPSLLVHTPQHVQALFLACERGFVDVVRDLLDRTDLHANVLMDSSVAPLYLACQMGHDAVVALLLERGADPNFRRPNGGVSCLYITAQEGKHHIVELLVRFGVHIHARMDDLSTALHIAARMGHTSVAQVLLLEGAGINDQTRSGLTPLYIASEEGHLAMVQVFLQQGADMNLQTKNGTSPLFVASQKSHTLIVRALLMAGANAHLPKNNGTYPMDAASLLGNYEVTKLLLQFGARVGGLSLHFAERRRDQKLQALLMDRYYEQHFQRVQDQPTRALM